MMDCFQYDTTLPVQFTMLGMIADFGLNERGFLPLTHGLGFAVADHLPT